MGGMDRFYQEKEEQKKKNPYGSGMARFYREQRYSSTDTSAVNDAYIDAFYNDWKNFASSAEKDYGGLGWGNASSSYESRNAAWKDLSARADVLEAYYFKNRNNVTDADGYSKMVNDLNDIRSSASDILKSFQAEADYYSNFATEDEFNEWNKYSHIPEASDFAEKSGYVSTYRGGEKYNAFANMYTDTGFDDIMYDYINRDENARQIKAVNDISNNSSFLGFDKSERREMSDEEISIFNYIYATQGKDAAYEYVDHITAGPVGLSARQRAKETEAWASYAKESPVASSIFSVLEAPLKGLSYIGQAADYISDGKIDQNAGYNKFSYINSAIRNQVTQDVEKNWGGVGSFAYQTGMSMADFLFTTAVSGGNSALSLGIMGTGAAADTVIYAKDRGLSDHQAFALGTIAGAAEIVTEKISLDTLLDATQLGKNALGYIAKNMIAEGSEEVLSSSINLIADVLISRDKSEWREAINAYKAVGMDDQKAFWHAVGDQALSLGLDFLGGAVSGGVMGGGGVALNAVNKAVNTSAQGAELKGSGIDAAEITRETLEINPDNRYAQKMQGKIDGGKTLSDYQLGKLVQQNETEMYAQDKAKIKSAVEARLTELGETGDVARLADVITKAQAGETLSRSENAVLNNSQNAQQVFSELDPENNESDWTGKIGTDRINAEAYGRLIAEMEAQPAPQTEEQTAPQAEAVPVTEGEGVKEGATAGTVNQTEATTVPNAEHIPETTKPVSEGEHSAYVNNMPVETTAETAGEESTVSLEEASAKYGDQAQAMVRTYQEGQDVQQYDSAYQMAYDMGKSGVSLSYVMQSKSTEYLTKQQRELAYEAGQAAAGIIAKAQHEKVKAAANGKTGRKKGTVKGDGVTIANLKKTFNDTQNTAYKILSTIAEVTGIDIVLYKSETNEKGDFVGAQGIFNRKDDKIYIDIHAGLTNVKDVNDLAKYAMLRTFSHEFTHFLEKYNAVWYNDFRKVVFETLTARGEDVADLIETKQAQNPGMDYDKASREVIAEAMTDILPDSQFIETLANKHKNIFTKIHDMLKEFLADLKAYFSSIGHNPSREANALKEQVGEAVRYVDNIVKMFDEGAAAAVDNYRMTVATDEKTEISENIEKTSHSQEKKEVTEYATKRTETEERSDEAYSGTNPTHEGSRKETFGKNGNGPRVPETVEETGRGFQQDRSSERHHQDEVDFLFDRKNDISPKKNSPLYNAQKAVAEEYGMECYILKASAWKRKNSACACEGKIYLSEDIDPYTLATFVPHETTHGINQKEFQPYQDFIDNTLEFINFTSEYANRLFKMISEHVGYNIVDIDDSIDEEKATALLSHFYDELNASVYGFQQGGIIDDPELDYGWIPGAFHDFDAYIKELSDIHEQFKAEIHKEKNKVTKHDERQEKNRTEDALAGGNPNDEGSSARTSEKDSNRSGVSKELGETKSELPQSRTDERQHREEVIEQYQKRGTESFSERTFSYDELTAKGDLAGTIIKIGTEIPLKADGSIDAKKIVSEVRKNCLKIRTNSTSPTHFIHVSDIDRNVQITDKSITHGFFGSAIKNQVPSPRNLINAKISLALPEILANSIEVNRSYREGNRDIPYTHVMIGAAAMENQDGTVEYYAVRCMVEERTNLDPLLVEAKIIGKLYALNAKKIDPSNLKTGTERSVRGHGEVYFEYSIADLLEDVKGVFKDTFSNNVYERLETKREDTEFSKNLQYQQRAKTLTDREILEMAADKVAVADLSEAERDALKIFQKRLSKVKDLQQERSRLSEIYAKQKHAPVLERKGDTLQEKQETEKKERKEAKTTLNEMLRLDEQIKQATAEVLSVEEKEVLRRVLTKSRKVVEAQQREHDREVLDRWRDGRQKTQIRRQILGAVKRLNAVFEGGKKRNVKEELKDSVAASLALSELIFSDELRNEDIARLGIEGVTEDERTLLKEYLILLTRKDGYIQEIDAALDQAREIAAALDQAQNDDTIEENVSENLSEELRQVNKRIPSLSKKLRRADKRISELDNDLSKVFERERNRLNRTTTVNVLMDTLAREYRELKNSDKAYIRAAYDDCIYTRITEIGKSFLGTTAVKDMSVSQLKEIYDVYRMVSYFIQKANKAFKAEQEASISDMAEEVMADMKTRKQKKSMSQAGKKLSSFDWNNLKPIYALRRIGSKVMERLFKNVLDGEGVWAIDMSEAQAFLEEQKKKYGYDKFDFSKKYRFRSATGQDFELTLGQIMSLYAYSRRGAQATEHLEVGGFKYDETTKIKKKTKLGISVTHELNDPRTYMLGNGILGEIIRILDDLPDVKGFTDAMQTYLSDVMGEKGNEVSLAMYGVKLFKEEHYFPLKTAEEYLEWVREQSSQTAKIKNKGFTKETKEGSYSPIVLSDFMDVWARHVNEMSMYHAFALPLEDFYRVYYYKTGVGDSSLNTEGVIPSIEGVHGKAATAYIDQLLSDLNGGARSDPREIPFKALTVNFKKAATMASLSVVIQQPSAIARATAVIDPKYFAGKNKKKISKKKQKATWAEMKKYAPVTIIKEMGYFDVGMGRSSVDWLKSEKTWKDKLDDKLSYLPAKADELTWCAIWNAVKRETASKNTDLNTSSEEFLRLAGERFTEVITKTQVYDSTLARSANMRSKSTFMNMLTSFMAEPTTSINMLQDAFRTGKKKYIARAMGAVYGSVLLNAALVSIVYAMRDDDKDETWWEKYLSRFTTEIIDGINPLTYIPFVKDIWSAAQGFDIERTDMSLITSLFDSVQGLVRVCGKDTSVMDEEELDEYRVDIKEAICSVTGDLASLTGFPLKNILRDLDGIINAFKTFARGDKTTVVSLGDNILEDVKDSIPVWGWFPDKSKSDKLYDAIIRGDAAYVERLKSGYKSESSYESAIRKALRENDPRIKEAAELRFKGDIAGYMKVAKAIIAEGHFKQDDIVAAINAEMGTMGEKSESEPSDKAVSLYKVDDYYKTITNGDSASAYAVKYDLIETDVANGKDRDEAEKKFNSDLTSYIQDEFKKGNITDYKARDMLSYAGKSAEEAAEKVQYWGFKKNYPDYDIPERAVSDWYSDVKPSGISLSVYYDYTKKSAKATGVDNNGDGKADSGTKKSEILQIIHSLPISSYQKDILYRLNGWAESTLYQAPWH